jgi:hypothetical protein
MTHSEFVKAWKSRQIEVMVDKQLAMRVMESADMPGRYRAAHLLWSWIWLLSIPVAIVLWIFVRWWVGIIMLAVGLLLPRAIKKSTQQFAIDRAIEDEEFYDKAISSKLLIINEKTWHSQELTPFRDQFRRQLLQKVGNDTSFDKGIALMMSKYDKEAQDWAKSTGNLVDQWFEENMKLSS